MPIYEYECDNGTWRCGTIELHMSGFDPPDETECECGQMAKRIISKSSFRLKGTGWYATDYKET